jgi:hypothetical protein
MGYQECWGEEGLMGCLFRPWISAWCSQAGRQAGEGRKGRRAGRAVGREAAHITQQVITQPAQHRQQLLHVANGDCQAEGSHTQTPIPLATHLDGGLVEVAHV